MQADHMMSAEEVEESIFLLPQSFTCNMFPSQWNIPTYDAWYRAQDETASYARFAKNLQLIGADAPGPALAAEDPHRSVCHERGAEGFSRCHDRADASRSIAGGCRRSRT